MNEEHDAPESSYRPSSPDLSGFTQANAPLPRLNRIPSYHAPADPNLPPGYSFSPRASYDASPYFSPSTTTPSSSYFGARNPPPGFPQPHPSQAFRTPSLPAQVQPQAQAHYPPPGHNSPPRQSRILGQPYNNPPPPHFSEPQFRQPFEQNAAQHYSAQPLAFGYPYGDMPRTRQSKAADGLDADYNPTGSLPTNVQPKVEPAPPSHPMMSMPMTDPSHGIDVRTKFPVARIKRIMQADEDVGKVAQATPTAVSKALELFMITLVTKGATEARANNSKRVTAQHLKAALMKDGQFDFLTEICENAPDEGSKKGRAKSEAKSEDSDDDIVAKKKAKGGRKRKQGSDDESD